MLAIFSDVHLTDETTARNVEVGAIHYLQDAIVAAARREIDEVRIVMLGDIVDFVRTDYWHRNGIPVDSRPWGGLLDPATGMNSNTGAIEHQFAEILAAIMAAPATRALLDMLNGLPEALGRPVNVTYVVGNHDRVFSNFPALRAMFAEALPRVTLEFTHALVAPTYGVLARHGHEWDDVCHGWTFARRVLRRSGRMRRFDEEAYRVMAIGEPITAELMSGLIHNVREQLAPRLDAGDAVARAFFDSLFELNNLRPIVHLFHWLAWMASAGIPGPLARRRRRGRPAAEGLLEQFGPVLITAVRDALDTLLRSSLVRRWERIRPNRLWWGDTTYHLRLLRALLRTGISAESLAWLVSTGVTLKSAWQKVFPPPPDDLVRGARSEFQADGIDPRIQYVVYGHTHEARHDCFSAPGPHEPVQMYINTGTYLPLIERSEDGQGYLTTSQMTMVFFYSETEDTRNRAGDGPTLAIWNGVRRKRHA